MLRINRKVAKAADSTGPERRIARTINQGWAIMEAGAMRDSALDAVQRGSVEGFMNALPWDDLAVKLGEAAEPLESAIGKQAQFEMGQIKASLSLDTIDDLSRRYAQTEAGQLITNITETQRATIREVLGDAFSGSLTKDQAARKIRQGIGLHPKWAQAVVNYEARQRNLPRPKGFSPARWEETLQARVRRYHDRLLRRRSDIIARTEIITAENLGRYATWADSISRGVNGADSRKEWAAGPEACGKVCRRLAGEIVRWDQAFSNGSIMPPGHPGCRCTAVLLPAPYKNPALNPRPIDWLEPRGDRGIIDLDSVDHGFDLLDNVPASFPSRPVRGTEADSLTYDSTLHWSDEKLMEQIGKYADDPEAIDKLLDIIDMRAAAEEARRLEDLAQAAARAEQQAALDRAYALQNQRLAQQAAESEARLAQAEAEWKARQAAVEANRAIEPKPQNRNTDPVTNPAARTARNLTQRQIVEEEYQQYIGAQIARAENELSVIFNNKNRQLAMDKGIDIYQLFTGPYHVAQKYASEELKEWWLVNSRETLGSFRYKAFHWASDKDYADTVRMYGHESGQARRNREFGL